MGFEKFDAIVVGAGVAGLSAAYVMAKAGLNVLVVERGHKPGSKNVVGGRLYTHSIKKIFPNFPDGANVERPVTKELFGLIWKDATITFEFSDKSLVNERHSYTVLRAKFDAWFASEVEKAGALIITDQRVDNLIIENGFVKGIVSGGDKVPSDMVIIAEGCSSILTEQAGLRKPYDSSDFLLGIKQVVELPKNIIEERFGLTGDDDGAAQLYFGDFTHGIAGGGVLYTNKDTVSVLITIKLDSAINKIAEGSAIDSHEVLNKFISTPPISRLLRGGKVVEYSAKLIPELSKSHRPKLYGNGVMVVGDAAGLIINSVFNLRGMDLAITSGIAAGETAIKGKEIGKFDAETLSLYQEKMKETLKEIDMFSGVWRIMENPRLYKEYPEIIIEILRDLTTVGIYPKAKLMSTILRHLKGVSTSNLIRDLLITLGSI
ncbi:MAG: FAD-dependent oxidoreductase [Thermoprotei archaeon]